MPTQDMRFRPLASRMPYTLSMLGTGFDVQFLMHSAVHQCAIEAGFASAILQECVAEK